MEPDQALAVRATIGLSFLDFFEQDPFARIFPGTIVRADLFSAVAPHPGPPIERYAGVAWPGGRFRNVEVTS